MVLPEQIYPILCQHSRLTELSSFLTCMMSDSQSPTVVVLAFTDLLHTQEVSLSPNTVALSLLNSCNFRLIRRMFSLPYYVASCLKLHYRCGGYGLFREIILLLNQVVVCSE